MNVLYREILAKIWNREKLLGKIENQVSYEKLTPKLLFLYACGA